MMFLDSTSHALQLIIALSAAVVLFALAFTGYARALYLVLVVMVPFQPIDSKYGSINMAVVYVVSVAMLLNGFRYKSGKLQSAPLIVPFVLLFFAFFISWSMAPKLFSSKYTLYLIQIGSNVAMFYMSYAFFNKERDLDTFFKALIFSNLLVIIYSITQVFVGYGKLSLFGIEELSLIENRADQRLVGPFRAVGITAEYLVIQSLILAHYIVQTGKLRRLGLLLMLCNFAVLIGTGNRGGFISALFAVVLFLYFYKRYIGGRGVLLYGVVFLFLLGSASIVMLKYTDFNVLYTRLMGTVVEGIIPDTRLGWGYVVERISERPIIGHGPRIVDASEVGARAKWPDGYISFYPHSLYLYILYTTGIVGFFAYGAWAVTYWRILCKERRRRRFSRGLGAGLSTLGMIVFVIFLIDQLKVEFLRSSFLDYQNYLAALFGMFVALKNIEGKNDCGDASASIIGKNTGGG